MRYRVYGRFNDNYFEGSKEECYAYIDMRLSEPWNGSFDFEEYRIKAFGEEVRSTQENSY